MGCHFLLQCMKVKSEREVAQSCPALATPWTVAYQAPLSMWFSRQKYSSGVPLPSLTCQCRRHKRWMWVLSLGWKIPWRREWQLTPVFLPGESHRQRSLAGYSPWGHTESDTTEHTHTHTHTHRLRQWFKNTRPVLRSMSKFVGEGLGL